MKPDVLNVRLPESIEKLKWAGQYDLAKQMIDFKIHEGKISSEMKDRLLLEKELLVRTQENYIYSKDDVLKILSENIKDWDNKEFDELFLKDAFEFIFVNGEMRFNSLFLYNITGVRPEYKERAITPFNNGNFFLDSTIEEMKREGQVHYRYTIRSTIKVKNRIKGKRLKVWLPIPIEGDQISNVEILSVSPKPTLINQNDSKHRCIYFEDYDNDEFVVEYRFINNAKYINPLPERVEELDINDYLMEQKPHIIFSDFLIDLTNEIIKDEKNPLVKARLIYDYITSHVMYSLMRPYITLPIISEYAASGLKGDCGVQALLFVTMCRIAKIPARWQSGLFISEDHIGNHDWAMFYVKPFGWLYADCSFGGAAYRNKLTERNDFYFGNLDPYRIVQASDFQIDLIPEKCFTRNDPYDNQNGEVEYDDMPIDFKKEAEFNSIVLTKEKL